MSDGSRQSIGPRGPRARSREDWTVRAGALGILLVTLATLGLAVVAAVLTALVALLQ